MSQTKTNLRHTRTDTEVRKTMRCPHCSNWLRIAGFRQDGGALYICDSCGWENRTGTYSVWATTPSAEGDSDI